MKHKSFRFSKTHSFTWTEFLIVTAIVALIIGVLIPLLNVSMRPRWGVVEMSNLRQIGIAMLNYAQDNNDVLPSHPRDAESYLGGVKEVWLSPYPNVEPVLDHGDDQGPVISYGCYLFVNLGMDLEETESPDKVLIACAGKVSSKQYTRSVLFADGHVEQWEEEKIRAAMPPEIDIDTLDGP